MGLLIIVAIIGIPTIIYGLICWIWPVGTCWLCRGKGRHALGTCYVCHGEGICQRFGKRAWAWLKREAKDAL